MNKKKIAYPKQVKYKDRISELGLKQSFVASKTGIHKTNLSSYINGHLFMTDNIKGRIDIFLFNYK